MSLISLSRRASLDDLPCSAQGCYSSSRRCNISVNHAENDCCEWLSRQQKALHLCVADTCGLVHSNFVRLICILVPKPVVCGQMKRRWEQARRHLCRVSVSGKVRSVRHAINDWQMEALASMPRHILQVQDARKVTILSPPEENKYNEMN